MNSRRRIGWSNHLPPTQTQQSPTHNGLICFPRLNTTQDQQFQAGDILISALPLRPPLTTDSATRQLRGIDAAIRTQEGKEAGHLVIKRPWPAMPRGVYGDPARYKKTYFKRFPGICDPEEGGIRL